MDAAQDPEGQYLHEDLGLDIQLQGFVWPEAQLLECLVVRVGGQGEPSKNLP